MTKYKTEEPSVITYAFIANIIYFFICAIYCKINSQSQILGISFFVLTVLLWFIIGNTYSKKLKQFNLMKFLSFVLINFVPILIFLITYNILTYMSINSPTYSWILFYSVGAPVIFWIKPASFLLNLFNVDFYVFAYLIVASFMCACFLGLISSRKKRRITTHKTAYIMKNESAGFASEAASAISIENNIKYQATDDTVNDTSEFDEVFDQVTFDNLRSVDDGSIVSNLDSIYDNSKKEGKIVKGKRKPRVKRSPKK